VRANHQIQTINQQLSKSNLQASKDNEDTPIPTVVNGVTWVKNHKKSDKKYNDYIENNTGEMEKSKGRSRLLAYLRIVSVWTGVDGAPYHHSVATC
jgi:hypothetical protein